MTRSKETNTGRRRFLTTVVPACALTCLTLKCASAQEAPTAEGGSAGKAHPFDAEFPHKLTHRQFYRAQYREAIDLAKSLQEEMGPEQALEFLKKRTSRSLFGYGEYQASQTTDHSLHQYTEQFRQLDNYRNSLIMEIVEDSEEAFELEVTACIWASTFRDADAGDLGFAMVCHGDYAWAQGFDARIELVRDKTLMQGDAVCNHRYVWRG